MGMITKGAIPVNFKEAEDGNTALHIAAEQDHPGLVKALLDAKADPDLKNDGGLKALDLTSTGTEVSRLLEPVTKKTNQDKRYGQSAVPGQRRESLGGV